MRAADERPDNSVKKPTKKKLETISRQKPWIDINIVNMGYHHGNNYTIYGLFHDDRPADEIHDVDSNTDDVWKNTNKACFAGLLDRLYKKKNIYNRMFYTIYLKAPDIKKNQYYNPGTNTLLSTEECVRWIQLTKEHKLLPDYVDENLIEMFDTPIKVDTERRDSHHDYKAVGKGTVIFDLTGLTQAQLYLYLSTLRHLREDPGFVRVALYLIDRCKMNFYAAYVFASYIAMNTTGHHTISAYRRYGAIEQKIDPKTGMCKTAKTELSDIENVSADISWMIGLQRFVKDPEKYDKNLVYKCMTSFRCNSTIDEISSVRTQINIYEALDPDIIKAIMAGTDRASKKYIDGFIEKKPRIKYKKALKEKEATGEE